MARKRKDRTERDITTIPNDELLPSQRMRLTSLPDVLRLLDEYRRIKALEDRRAFHPVGRRVRPVQSLTGDARRLVPVAGKVRKVGKRVGARIPRQVGFALPRQVPICVRRQERREVLFALRRTGRGAKSFRRRRNWHSEVRC